MSSNDGPVRIQKWLSQMGVTSRREAERLILDGKIKVNGKTVKEMGTKIDPDLDKVSVNGKILSNKEPPRVYWMFNKPDLYLTAAIGQEDKRCIFDLPKLKKVPFKLSPVGRLDYNTEGLLLLSNDGELVHRLSHPSFKLPRIYQVMINKRLSEDEERALKKGIELEDGPVKKVELRYLDAQATGKSSGQWYIITVYEGRNRLVRRIFEHFGRKVKRLIRSGFGDLKLDLDLKAGDYRQLTTKEIKYLKKQVDLLGDANEVSKPARRDT